jgi:hypothetical protein
VVFLPSLATTASSAAIISVFIFIIVIVVVGVEKAQVVWIH